MIRVNFSAYNNYVTDSLHQWDLNQDLSIHGLNISVAPEIHFANVTMDRVIVKQGELNRGVVTVRIPNTMLQAAFPIKAYIGVYNGSTFTVIETVEIPVIAKPRPSDYVFEDTDGEVYSYNRLENRMNTIIAANSGQPNNAELVDIRNGADDHTYTTAGEAVRTQITRLTGRIDTLNSGGLEISDELINNKVDTWLNEHPEAISTVLDNSVTTAKLADGCVTEAKLTADLKPKILNDYVTPEMFGARGDGSTNDTAAFVTASGTRKPLLVTKNYSVTNIALPKIVFGYGQIQGSVVAISANGSEIEGIQIKGKLEFHAPDSKFLNCTFTDCEVDLSTGGNRFTNCSFSNAPITCSSEIQRVNTFTNCTFSSTDQFKGSPAKLLIMGGQINGCTNVFNLNNTTTVSEVIIEHCYLTECVNLIRCGNDVTAEGLLFSKCVINNRVRAATVALNTDDSTTNTNTISVKFLDCDTDNFTAFTRIKNIRCDIQGLRAGLFPTDSDEGVYGANADVCRHDRTQPNPFKVPASWIVRHSDTQATVVLPEPMFIGKVISDRGEVTAEIWLNGHLSTAVDMDGSGNELEVNATCYGFWVTCYDQVLPSNITITTTSNLI